jgi:tetratricopeptide (TPR) repeat protein
MVNRSLGEAKTRRNLDEIRTPGHEPHQLMKNAGALVLRQGDVEIDLGTGQVLRGGVVQHLRQKSLRVLLYLIENRDRTVSKQELLETIWNDVAVTDDTLVQSIVEIRKVLGEEARDAQFIRTLPRLGYRFVAPVAPAAAAEVAEEQTAPAVTAALPKPQPARFRLSHFRLSRFRLSRFRLSQRAGLAIVAVLVLAGVTAIGVVSRRRAASETPARSLRLVDAMTDDLGAYRLYSRGVERAQALHNQEAIALFEQALARDPDFAMAHARIGYVYGVTWTQQDRARPHLERALQLGDRLSEKDRLNVEAWRAIVDGQYSSAIELYRSVIARYPTETEAYLRAGNLLVGEERFAEAAGVLERGLVVDPTSPGLYNALGAVYLFLGRKEDAIAAHRRYVELAPAEPNAHDSLGITWQAIGEYDRAVAEYQAALRLDPRFDIARIHLSNTWFQMGRFRDATHELELYIEKAPSDIERARGYLGLAAIARSRGDLAGARRYAQRAAIVPSIARSMLLQLALDRSDFAGARAIEAEIPMKLLGRGARLTLRGTHYLRGYEAQQAGEEEKALEFFRQALRYQPPHFSNDTMEDCLANAYSAFGRHAEAAREYERVLRFNPNHAQARLHLARTYRALGRTEEASGQYRRFLETWAHADPGTAELLEARRMVGR